MKILIPCLGQLSLTHNVTLAFIHIFQNLAQIPLPSGRLSWTSPPPSIEMHFPFSELPYHLPSPSKLFCNLAFSFGFIIRPGLKRTSPILLTVPSPTVSFMYLVFHEQSLIKSIELVGVLQTYMCKWGCGIRIQRTSSHLQSIFLVLWFPTTKS